MGHQSRTTTDTDNKSNLPNNSEMKLALILLVVAAVSGLRRRPGSSSNRGGIDDCISYCMSGNTCGSDRQCTIAQTNWCANDCMNSGMDGSGNDRTGMGMPGMGMPGMGP